LNGLLVDSHHLISQCWVHTLLYHCQIGGTLVNIIEVDRVQVAELDTGFPNTWQSSAWVIPVRIVPGHWVKVTFQVTLGTHVTFCRCCSRMDHHLLRTRCTCVSNGSRGVPARGR
jgi:hypothetical protein